MNTIRAKVGAANDLDINTGTEHARLELACQLNVNKQANAYVKYAQMEFMSLNDEEPDCAIMQYSLGMGNFSLDELFQRIDNIGQEKFKFINLADELLAAWIANDTDGKNANYRASITFNEKTEKFDVIFHNIDADQTLSDESPNIVLNKNPGALKIKTSFNSVLLLILLNYPNVENNFESIKKHLNNSEFNVFHKWLIATDEQQTEYSGLCEKYPVIVCPPGGTEVKPIRNIANLETVFKQEVLDGVEKRISRVNDKIKVSSNLLELIKEIDPVTLSSYEHNIAIRDENDQYYPGFVAQDEYEASQIILQKIKETKQNLTDFKITQEDINHIFQGDVKTHKYLDIIIIDTHLKNLENNNKISDDDFFNQLTSIYPELETNYKMINDEQTFKNIVKAQYQEIKDKFSKSSKNNEIEYYAGLLNDHSEDDKKLPAFLKYHLSAIPLAWSDITADNIDDFIKCLDEEILRLKRCALICAENSRDKLSQTKDAPMTIKYDNDKQLPEHRYEDKGDSNGKGLSEKTEKAFNEEIAQVKELEDNTTIQTANITISNLRRAKKEKEAVGKRIKTLLKEDKSALHDPSKVENEIRRDFTHKNVKDYRLSEVKEFWAQAEQLKDIHLENCEQMLDDLYQLEDKFNSYEKALIKKVVPYTEIESWEMFEKFFPEDETYLSQLYLYKFSTLLKQLKQLKNKGTLNSYQIRVQTYLRHSEQQQDSLEKLLTMYESALTAKKSTLSEDEFNKIKVLIRTEISTIDFKYCYKLNTPDERNYYQRVIRMLCDLDYDNNPIILQNFTALKKEDFDKIIKSKDLNNNLSEIYLYGADTLIRDLKLDGEKHQKFINHLSQQQSLSHFMKQYEELAASPIFLNETPLLKSMQGADLFTSNNFVISDAIRYFESQNSAPKDYPENFLGIIPYLSSPDIRLRSTKSNRKLSTSIEDNFKAAFNLYFDNISEEKALDDLQRYARKNRKETHFTRLFVLTKHQGLLKDFLNGDKRTKINNKPLINTISGHDAYKLLMSPNLTIDNYKLILEKYPQKLASYLNAHPEKYVALLSHFYDSESKNLPENESLYYNFVERVEYISQKRKNRASTHDARVFILSKDENLKENNNNGYIKNFRGKDIHRLLTSSNIKDEIKIKILKKPSNVEKLINYCDDYPAAYLELARKNESLIKDNDNFLKLFSINKGTKTHNARVFIVDIKERDREKPFKGVGTFLNQQPWVKHFNGKDLFRLISSDNLSISRFNAIWKTHQHRESIIKFCNHQPDCWLILLNAAHKKMSPLPKGYEADDETNSNRKQSNNASYISEKQFRSLFRSALVQSDNAMIASQIKRFVKENQTYFTPDVLNQLFTENLFSIIQSFPKKNKGIANILSELDNSLEVILNMKSDNGGSNLLLKYMQISKTDSNYVTTLISEISEIPDEKNAEKLKRLLKYGSENTKHAVKALILNQLNELSKGSNVENYQPIINLLNFCYSDNLSIIYKFSMTNDTCIKAVLEKIQAKNSEAKLLSSNEINLKKYLENIKNLDNSKSSVGILGCFGPRKKQSNKSKTQPSSSPHSKPMK